MQTKLRNSENKSLTNRSTSSYDSSEREAHKISESFKHSSDVKNDMSNKLGIDFSSVRVHSGAGAAQKAEGMGKAAFAQGSDVFMGSSNALSSAGVTQSQALAHELTHTVQQGAATQTGGAISQSAPMGSIQGIDLLDRFRYWAGGGGKKAGKGTKEWLAGGEEGSWRANKAQQLAQKEAAAGTKAFEDQRRSSNAQDLQNAIDQGEVSEEMARKFPAGTHKLAIGGAEYDLAAFDYLKETHGMTDEDHKWVTDLLISGMSRMTEDGMKQDSATEMADTAQYGRSLEQGLAGPAKAGEKGRGHKGAYGALLQKKTHRIQSDAFDEVEESGNDYAGIRKEIERFLMEKYGTTMAEAKAEYLASEKYAESERKRQEKRQQFEAKRAAEAAAQARAAMTPEQLQQEADQKKVNLAADASDAAFQSTYESPDYGKFGYGLTADDMEMIHPELKRRIPSILELLDQESKVNLTVMCIGRKRQSEEEPEIFQREKSQVLDAVFPFIWQAFKTYISNLDTPFIFQCIQAFTSQDDASIISNYPRLAKMGATAGNFSDLFKYIPKLKSEYPNQEEIEQSDGIRRLIMGLNSASNMRLSMIMSSKENPDMKALMTHIKAHGIMMDSSADADGVEKRIDLFEQGIQSFNKYETADNNVEGFARNMRDPQIIAGLAQGKYSLEGARKAGEHGAQYEKEKADKKAAAEAPKKKKRWFF